MEKVLTVRNIDLTENFTESQMTEFKQAGLTVTVTPGKQTAFSADMVATTSTAEKALREFLKEYCQGDNPEDVFPELS